MSGAPWPADDDERLATLWRQGMSGRLIGLAMGRSKSSVIARAHRLGLAGRPSPLPPPGYVKQPRKRVRATLPEAPAHMHKAPRFWIVASDPVRGCQWPSGERFHIRFCGAPAARDRPYCLGHCRIAYIGYRSASPAAMAAAS